MQFVSHYMADHVTSFSTGNILTPVPEPSTLVLAGFAAVGLAAYRRRSKLRKSDG
jgi:hypothetical protein